MSVATRVVGASSRLLCAVGVALAISLMYALLGATASTTPMPGMTGQVNASGVSPMGDLVEATGAAAVAPVGAATTVEMGAGGALMPASMCESPCVADISGACTIAGGLAAAALLALLLGTRRDTFLGLLARLGPLFSVRRPRHEPTPWTVLSLTSLCVLRV